MAKHKHFHIILIGFLFLKESSTSPWKNENTCTPSSQGRYKQVPPYVVIIKTNSNEEILCQGTLINVNWVLTPAQCMNNNNISLENINLTMGNRTQKLIRKAKKIIVDKNSNVAIIEMDRPIIVTDSITPIKLAAEVLSQKMKCVVSGFQEYSNDDSSHLHRRISVIYWTNANISKQMFDMNELYLEDTICHKQLWSLRNILQTTNKGIILVCDQYLYGINFVNKPRVFYNILNYKNWIQNMMDQTITNEMTKDTNKSFVRNNYLLSYFNTSKNAIETESNGTTMNIEETTESDDPTSIDPEETIAFDAPSSTYEEETESDDPTSEDAVVTITSDVFSSTYEETESDDPTSEDAVVTIASDAPSSTYEEETESDDPTSPSEEDSTTTEKSANSTEAINTSYPSETTTIVNEPSSDKSSSQIISFNVNCATVLCCIIFYLTL